jgi:hypothetical protein
MPHVIEKRTNGVRIGTAAALTSVIKMEVLVVGLR